MNSRELRELKREECEAAALTEMEVCRFWEKLHLLIPTSRQSIHHSSHTAPHTSLTSGSTRSGFASTCFSNTKLVPATASQVYLFVLASLGFFSVWNHSSPLPKKKKKKVQAILGRLSTNRLCRCIFDIV